MPFLDVLVQLPTLARVVACARIHPELLVEAIKPFKALVLSNRLNMSGGNLFVGEQMGWAPIHHSDISAPSVSDIILEIISTLCCPANPPVSHHLVCSCIDMLAETDK